MTSRRGFGIGPGGSGAPRAAASRRSRPEFAVGPHVAPRMEEGTVSKDLYAAALAKVKEYRGQSATLGQGPMAELSPEVDRMKDELLWGVLWSDPSVDIKTRSLCTISALIVLGKEEQLKNHMGWALHVGVTKQ